MNISHSLTKSLHYLNLAILTFVSFAASVLILIPKQPVSLQVATSIVHSKLDYCNSLYYNLPKSQIRRLQQIHNSLARAVFKAPKFTHTTPILKSLQWLKINERVECKILYLTFKLHCTTQPPYLHDLISLQTPRNTRSSSLVTLARPPTRSSLKITSRFFRYALPYLWNQLPHSLRQPRLDRGEEMNQEQVDHLTSRVSSSPLLLSITPSFLFSNLKTVLFLKSYPL